MKCPVKNVSLHTCGPKTLEQHCLQVDAALELGAKVVLKATRVDGVYSDDPEKNPHSVLYGELSYHEVREQNLRVMDPTAITQCMEHDMPILVFNYKKEGNIERAVNGERVGTNGALDKVSL